MSGKRPYRLLMIDDDAALNSLLSEYFERFGHQLSTATTAAEGRQRIRREEPDLLILDVMLPDADGMELCRSIRAESDLPIVMLTARGDLPDRVLGLEFGADDYIPKPFEPRELVARVETLMRRSSPSPPSTLTVGDLMLDGDTRRVTRAGREIELTSAEFELLRLLMAERGRVLSRETLLRRLRGGEAEVYDRSVDMLVSRVRKKLGDDSRSSSLLKTIRGVGYQFVGASDS